MTRTSANAGAAAARLKVTLVAPGPACDLETQEYAEGLRRVLSPFADAEIAPPSSANIGGAGRLAVYHLRNQPNFAATYQAALKHPGVVVLHDAVLNHVLLSSLPEQQYVEEFVFNYGEWLRPLAIEMWREWQAEGQHRRSLDFPMVRRLVQSSRGIIVHNPKALRLVKEAGAGGASSERVFEIPRWVELPEELEYQDRAALREQYHIPPEAIVISCVGPFQPETRLRSLFEAVAVLSLPYRILLVGDFLSAEFQSAFEPFIEELPVVRVSRPSGHEVWRLLQLADIGVSLSHPSTGRSPHEACGWMALAKPVIMTAGEETSALPAAAVARVDAGEAESEMLAHYLYALAADESMRREMGEQARQYVLSRHLPEHVAPLYMHAIERSFSLGAAR